MKNALVFHGTGDTPDRYWFPFVRDFLERRGYEVWLPALPNAATPNVRDWLSFVLERGHVTSDTLLIGHSAGSQLILNLLETLSEPVRQAVLVSGYARGLRKNAQTEEYAPLNWETIKTRADQFVFINSDNDPWGCDDRQGRLMLERLGGILVIPHGEGHMGSTSFSQPYTEFPLLTRLLDV